MRLDKQLTAFIALIAMGWPVAAAHSAERPPTTNPAHLRELAAAHRAPLLEGIRVSYRYWTSDMPGDAAGAVESLAWNERGVRAETGQESVEVSAYDHASGVATKRYADGVVEQSTDPDLVGFGVAGLQCEYVLGMYPTRDVGARAGFTNDLMHRLSHPGAVVLPEMVQLDGLECVVVDMVRRSPAGDQRTVSRGYYAPSLGYAQVMLEFFAPSGCMVSSWKSSQFIEPLPGATSIPTRGEFRNDECSGDVLGWVVVEMETDAAGAPAVVVGADVITDLQVPVGTWIQHLDTGRRTHVVGASSQPVAASLGVNSTDPSPLAQWSWLTWPLVLVTAFGALAAGWLARRSFHGLLVGGAARHAK